MDCEKSLPCQTAEQVPVLNHMDIIYTYTFYFFFNIQFNIISSTPMSSKIVSSLHVF